MRPCPWFNDHGLGLVGAVLGLEGILRAGLCHWGTRLVEPEVLTPLVECEGGGLGVPDMQRRASWSLVYLGERGAGLVGMA